MTQYKHIINKQTIEIELPKKADVFGVQQKLGKLYSERFTPIIDKLLCDHYGTNEEQRYQIDKLTVDLGHVEIENITAVFTEKFNDALRSVEDLRQEQSTVEEKESTPQNTPIQVVSYYLMRGRFPWWSSKTTKTYVLEQLDQLIKIPDAVFTKLLAQLPFNHVYLDRFLYTFTEEQILLCLQILTDISVKELLVLQKKISGSIQKISDHTDIKIARTFWKVAFNQVPRASNYRDLVENCKQQTFQELDIDVKETKKGYQNTDLPVIRSLAKKYKRQYADDIIWPHFFEHLISVVNHPSFYQIPDPLLKELKRLLETSSIAQHKTEKPITKTILQPIARHLQLLETMLKPLQPNIEPVMIEKLQSNFEDVDFITVQNAGLVLLWPFLQRFFENIGVMKDKAFLNEIARNKAVCALQYLCNTTDTEFFEGMLPFTKVLCGVLPEDAISPISLSEAEKEMTEDLLHAVIARGPHWKNISLDGFRTSYLCRQGSLRMRDDHWLLQVKKETYDVTLEKLPWGFSVVKLPWMQAVLMVEWI